MKVNARGFKTEHKCQDPRAGLWGFIRVEEGGVNLLLPLNLPSRPLPPFTPLKHPLSLPTPLPPTPSNQTSPPPFDPTPSSSLPPPPSPPLCLLHKCVPGVSPGCLTWERGRGGGSQGRGSRGGGGGEGGGVLTGGLTWFNDSRKSCIAFSLSHVFQIECCICHDMP